MNDSLLRAALVLIGLFMLTNGLAFLFAIESINPMYGLSTTSPLGRASIRADFGGFFNVIGVLAIWAALKRHSYAAFGAALLYYFALSGRFVSLLIDGPVDGGTFPMLFEAVCGTFLLFASNKFKGPASIGS